MSRETFSNIMLEYSALHRELDRVKCVLESPRKLLKDSHALLSETRKKGEEEDKVRTIFREKGLMSKRNRTTQKCLVEKGAHGPKKGLSI